LLPLAKAAAARGQQPTFLVSNPDEVAPLLHDAGFELRSAPTIGARHRLPVLGRAVAHTFADILGTAGFDDARSLAAATRAWDDLVSDLRPVAAVCELSPLLCLSAYAGQLPLLVTGYGFVLPPPELPQFPPLSRAQPQHAEAMLLDNVRAVLRARGRPVPDTLPALLAGDAHFVTGLDELDPYRELRSQAAVGPPGIEPGPVSRGAREEVFAYLLGDAPATLSVLTALARTGARGRVFVRRGTHEHRQAVTGGGLTWLERPGEMRRMLQGARLVVHHGSMLTAEETLLGGRAQLVVPLYLEHLLTARALVALGAARVLAAGSPPELMGDTIAAMRQDTSLARAAESFCARAADAGRSRTHAGRDRAALLNPR
jgi:hypothetical protein